MLTRLEWFRRFIIFVFCSFVCTAASDSIDWEEYYLDVQPANTSWHLTAIRALPLRQYRLGGENKIRIGIIGPEVGKYLPNAVELLNKKPGYRGNASPTTDSTESSYPAVNEHTLFMYGIGATKELATQMENISGFMNDQRERIMVLYETAQELERIFNNSRDEAAELRMKEATLNAALAKMDMDIALQREKAAEEYLEKQRLAEYAQLELNEKIALNLAEKEQLTTKLRNEEIMQSRVEASQKTEMARLHAAQELSKLQYDKNIALQKATEEMKVKTAKAIAEANAEVERANEDIRLRKLRAEAEQRRERNAAIINTISHQISATLKASVQNPKKAFIFIIYISSLVLTFHAAREGAKLCRLLIESTIGRPKLLRETSRKPLIVELVQALFYACSIVFFKSCIDADPAHQPCELVFEDVILPPILKDRVISIAKGARKVRKYKTPYRHVLFYGPPGTGKTMVARKLAKCIGIDYALMSGGDVGPLGADAVTQIHNLFMWSKLSRKGVLLFIDEAEAFLAKRNRSNMSETAHNALNALLYNTGSERNDFMLILATNRAEDLDPAILDRCDESLMFPLPDDECRYHLIRRYFDHYVTKKQVPKDLVHKGWRVTFQSICSIFAGTDQDEDEKPLFDYDAMDESQIKDTVKSTSGFSGREIGKLMIAMQGVIHSNESRHLSRLHCQELIDSKVDEHRQKMIIKNDRRQ